MSRNVLLILRYITWKSLLLKIIISTITDSWRRIKQFKFITGSLGSVVGFFLLFYNFLNYSKENSIILSGRIAFNIIILLLSYYLIKNIILYIQKWTEITEWGDAILVLAEVKKTLRHIMANPYDDKIYKEDLRKICNIVKKYYDVRTDSDCSVSIKVGTGKGTSMQDITLVNLVRDDKHRSRDTEKYINTNHTILANTPFSYISAKLSSGKMAYYINNNIHNTPNYLNSSRDTYSNGILPYSSEFVVPIMPLVSNDSSIEIISAGFLCIDSNKKDSFQDTKYDKSFLIQISDILSNVIN